MVKYHFFIIQKETKSVDFSVIERKTGIINNIIYDNTAYHNVEYRIYSTFFEFKRLIKETWESNSTTERLLG